MVLFLYCYYSVVVLRSSKLGVVEISNIEISNIEASIHCLMIKCVEVLRHRSHMHIYVCASSLVQQYSIPWRQHVVWTTHRNG